MPLRYHSFLQLRELQIRCLQRCQRYEAPRAQYIVVSTFVAYVHKILQGETGMKGLLVRGDAKPIRNHGSAKFWISSLDA